MKNSLIIDVSPSCPSPEWLPLVEPFIQSVLERFRYFQLGIVCSFCNDQFIAELNKQYRNIDSPTDVLSFEQGEDYTTTKAIHYLLQAIL